MLDGIYIARPQAQEVSFFDIERVEVLRGPQGTLYGRNTTAGVVNVITTRPQLDEFSGSFDLAYGSYANSQATSVINIPVSDKIALRAAANHDKRDSFIDQAPGAQHSLDPFKDNLSGRLSALFEFSEDMNFLVRADYSRQEGVPNNLVPTVNFYDGPFDEGSTPRYRNPGSDSAKETTFTLPWQTGRDNDTWGITAEYNWDLASDYTLTYLGSYREMTRREQLDAISGANRATFAGDYWQNSQELRLAYDAGGALQVQAGFYYFKEKSGIEFFILDPQNIGFPPIATQFGFPQDPTIAANEAAFGQLTYAVLPDLKLTAGVRYSEDDKSRVGGTVFDTVSGDRIFLQDNNAQRTFRKTTWRLAADYDIPELGLVYASVSTDYKAGGFNDGCEIGNGPTCALPAEGLYYEPETLKAYEAGFKFRLLDNRLQLNGGAFHYDYKGLQLSSVTNACGGPCQITSNAGVAEVDGVELETVFAPNEQHRFDANINWLDAQYVEFAPKPTVDFSGVPLSRSPEYTASLGYSFTQPIGGGSVVASVRVRFSDSYALTQLDPAIFFVQPSFHKTDLSVTYNAPMDRFYVQGFVKNLEDEVVLTGAGFNNFGVGSSFEDPRTYGIRAGIRF